MTIFEKIQPITVYDAVLYAKLQSIVNFLPQVSFIATGDGELYKKNNGFPSMTLNADRK